MIVHDYGCDAAAVPVGGTVTSDAVTDGSDAFEPEARPQLCLRLVTNDQTTNTTIAVYRPMYRHVYFILYVKIYHLSYLSVLTRLSLVAEMRDRLLMEAAMLGE